MKKIILFFLVAALATTVFSQQTATPPLTKADSLQKNKTQKTIAWVLAGAGVTSVIFSIATADGTEIFSSIAGNNKPINRFGVLFFGGSAVAISSIPLFIASGKNKRKAMTATTYLKMQTMPLAGWNSFVQKSYPSLAVKINLK